MSQPAPFVCATPRNSGFSPMRRRLSSSRCRPPLTIPATDDEQRVIVKLPDGFEYKESEIAQAKTLTSSGGIK